MAVRKNTPVVAVDAGLAKITGGETILGFEDGQVIYSQGDAADSMYYIQAGKVKRAVVCRRGKEAVFDILGPGDFFGEGCLLGGDPVRLTNAVSVGRSVVVRLKREAMTKRLRRDAAFAAVLLAHTVSHARRVEEDLIDHLFNSTEKRLARVLLRLANFGGAGEPERVVPKINQETLAQMVGASRSRVSSFLNKFRKLGFIEYNGELRVHNSLLTVILRD